MTAEARLRVWEGNDEMVVGINNGLVTNSAVREAAADELGRTVAGTPGELAGDGIGMGEYGPDESCEGNVKVNKAGESEAGLRRLECVT